MWKFFLSCCDFSFNLADFQIVAFEINKSKKSNHHQGQLITPSSTDTGIWEDTFCIANNSYTIHVNFQNIFIEWIWIFTSVFNSDSSLVWIKRRKSVKKWIWIILFYFFLCESMSHRLVYSSLIICYCYYYYYCCFIF